MLSVVLIGLSLGVSQPIEREPARPAVECATHLTDWRARRSCLQSLLEAAETELGEAAEYARGEAEQVDFDSGGHFDAASAFTTAQEAWLTYRDAECTRRAALMIVSAESREEIELDCRIALSRARAAELREN